MAEGVNDQVRNRQRRNHTKSRYGCRNCKLRRIKCDEARPQCERCVDFKVRCNYDFRVPDLQMVSSGPTSTTALPVTRRIPSRATKPVCLDGTNLSLGRSIPAASQDRHITYQLERFRRGAACHLGTKEVSSLYQNQICGLAVENPYLMHSIMALTATHERLVALPPTSRRTREEAYHCSRAAALFNKRLSQGAYLHDSDALLVTTALMGVIALSSIEASHPTEAWPLKDFEQSGLDWLNLVYGKTVIGNLVGPLKPDSILHPIYPVKESVISTGTHPMDNLPEDLASLCGLNNSLVHPNGDNPYHKPGRFLDKLWHVECTQSSFHIFLPFLLDMDSSFQQRLRQKDPRALLLLAFWYAKVRRSAWWIAKRATLECQAICLFLESHCAGKGIPQGLLSELKVGCGLL